MSPAEILAAINELPADEAKQFATDFHNDTGKVVAAAKARSFAAGKTQGETGGKDAAAKLAEAVDAREQAEAALEELKAKTPDVAAIEARWRAKVDAEKTRADQAITAGREKDVSLVRRDFLTALGAPAEDGTRVNPAYLKVAEVEWGNRIRVADDGTVRVLQLGQDMPYDAADTGAAVKLLAADARKQVPADFVLANADPNGGGVRHSTGGGGASGGGPRDLFGQIRQQVQKDVERRQQTGTSGAARLGIRPNAPATAGSAP